MKHKQVTFGANEVMQIVVFTLVAVLGPLLFFPRTFEVTLSFSFTTLLILEALYYVIVFSVFNSGAGLKATLLGVILATLYRFTLAALFGLMISAPGGVILGDALREGFYGYWPGFVTFVLCSPFVLLSFVKWLIDRLDGTATEPMFNGLQDKSPSVTSSPSSMPTNDFGLPGANEPQMASVAGGAPYLPHVQNPSNRDGSQDDEFAFGADADRQRTAPGAVSYSGNGFERAVNYLGEDGSVKVAAIVDLDGLEVASFSRSDFSSESWSPFALSLVEENTWIMERFQQSGPHRVELHYNELKVECRLVGRLILLVVSEIHDDDVLGVRLSQASDLIGKYISARYSETLFAGMEEHDVRRSE